MPKKVPPMAPTAFSTPEKAATPRETPTKETPWKSEQTPSKKNLTPDTTSEPPVKKQRTGSATVASDSEADQTEEQQEKCQWVKKFKHELQGLVWYRESHNIFLHNLPVQGSSSHIGYLESRITEASSGFFIRSIKAWWNELETQSQGVGQNADAAWCRLLILESKAKERLSTAFSPYAPYVWGSMCPHSTKQPNI